MPYDLFWHGEPSLYFNYLDAYNKQRDDENEAFVHKENFKAWLQGYYVDCALACNHPFAKKKEPYLKEPIPMKDEKKEAKKEVERESGLTEKEEKEAIAQFMAFGQLVEVMNNKRKENGK